MRRIVFLLLCCLILSCKHIDLSGPSYLPQACRARALFVSLSNLSANDLAKKQALLLKQDLQDPLEQGCRDVILGHIEKTRHNDTIASTYFAKAAEHIPQVAPYMQLQQAHLLIEAKQVDEAKEVLASLKLNTHAKTAWLEQQINKLNAKLVPFVPPEKAPDLLTQIKQLTRDGNYGAVIRLGQKQRAVYPYSKNDIALQVLVVEALAYNNRADQAIARAKDLSIVKHAPDEWRMVYGWALSKADKNQAAQEVYQHIERITKKHDIKEKACLYAGFSAYDDARYQSAIDSWSACKSALKHTVSQEPVDWLIGFSYYLMGAYDSACAHIQQVVETYPNSLDKPKYLFWLGRVQKQAGDESAAIKSWQQAARAFPITYYGLLARREINTTAILGSFVDKNALKQKAVGEQAPWAKTALLLYNLGFDEAASSVILQQKKVSDDALGLLQICGNYHDAWRRGANRVPTPCVIENRLVKNDAWRAFFPMPWDEIIERACRNKTITPTFVYALIHQESGFLPTAKSHKGAIGVLQIKPSDAMRLAPKTAKFSVDDLNSVPVSLNLSVRYLEQLKARVKYNYLAAASYNAGSDVVARWQKQFGGVDVVTFIERIPYKETREYVKNVIVKTAIYEALLGKPLVLSFE